LSDSAFGERDLRAIAICAGAVLAVTASCFGVDGMLHASAGVLIGFGVGKGADKTRVKERALKWLKE